VGEWLKPADCKSAAPCGLRRFESSPVHQRLERGPHARQRPGKKFVKQLMGNRLAGERKRCFPRGAPWWKSKGVSGGNRAWVAQLVERVLGKDEVTGSIPVPGSTLALEMSGGNSGVESLPSKQMVAGSNPVPRSIRESGADLRWR
jgi:hypothetical protein